MDTIYEQGLTIFDFRSLFPEEKKFVANVAVRSELGEKKREMVSRNVRKEDATYAKGKFVEIYSNMEIDTWKALVGGFAALRLNENLKNNKSIDIKPCIHSFNHAFEI